MLIFLIFSLLIFFLLIVYSYRYGITPMPSHRGIGYMLEEEIPLKFKGSFVDLGSGWGFLLCRLAKQRPHCQFVGYEISPIPFFFSILLKWVFRIKNVTIYRRNFYGIPLSQFDFIFCYLFTQAMRELEEKAQNEMKSKSVLISNTFAFPRIAPFKVRQTNNLYRSNLYFYKAKAS